MAQIEFDNLLDESGEVEGATFVDWNRWPIELSLVFVAFLAATVFNFYVVFPWMLRKRKPLWPKTAYGRCATLVLTTVFFCVLAVFWEDLERSSGGGSQTFATKWGGRIGLIVVWVFFASTILYIMRSPHRAK